VPKKLVVFGVPRLKGKRGGSGRLSPKGISGTGKFTSPLQARAGPMRPPPAQAKNNLWGCGEKHQKWSRVGLRKEKKKEPRD